MNDDRQLLELAAKAAGYEVVWLESSYYGPTMARVEVKSGEGEITEPWNPLTDDGDALRLAVKLSKRNGLGLTLILADSEDHTVVVHDCNDLHITEELDSDTSSATRRAIVRAAAEIGKEMA